MIIDMKKGVVQFVQVTIAKEHSFKLAFFLQSLQGLGVPEKNQTAGEALEANGDPARRGKEVKVVFVSAKEAGKLPHTSTQ
eukprot:768351-Hanusia_phi.AAC.11